MNYVIMVKWSLLFCAVFVLSGCVFHRPAYYPAQVLMKDGTPCFSVANRRKERTSTPIISAIDVLSYVNDKEIKPVWGEMFMRDRPPMKLSPHECLVYGVGEKIVPSLRNGYRYGVSISASVDNYGVFYFSYFCLSITPDGDETEIHRVKWSKEINGFDWRVCGIKD